MISFLGIDVETANSSPASVCQIGLADCRPGTPDVTRWLVNPAGPFDRRNVAIHGIEERDVAGAPGFPSIYPALRRRMTGRLMVAHSRFDAEALGQAVARDGQEPFETEWIDTVVVARHAWPHLPDRSLGAMAAHLGYAFSHHDAGDDAVMACLILLRAIRQTRLGLEHWRNVAGYTRRLGEGARVRAPMAVYSSAVSTGPTASGPLDGHCLCITGETATDRDALANLLAAAGATVRNSVTGKTTMLVANQSSATGKYREAVRRRAEGQAIEIITETTLLALIGQSSPENG